MSSGILISLLFLIVSFAGCVGSVPLIEEDPLLETSDTNPLLGRAHVVVSSIDTGINPYHVQFFDETRTEHPCTYLLGYPCDVPALPLTIGSNLTYEELVEKDENLWLIMQPGKWFWIPQTKIVALGCLEEYAPTVPNPLPHTEYCGLSDSHSHGTTVASEILRFAPEASLVIAEGMLPLSFVSSLGAPIDVQSISIGDTIPLPGVAHELTGILPERTGVIVIGAGNDPLPAPLDSLSGSPEALVIGGGYGEGGDELLSRRLPDFAQDYCVRAADAFSTTGYFENCGTSFATPRVSGLVANLILRVREHSGYRGLGNGTVLDPVLNLTVDGLREVLNSTATYTPGSSGLSNPNGPSVPSNPAAPWLGWGWGYLTNETMNTTFEVLIGNSDVPERDVVVSTAMAASYEIRKFQRTGIAPFGNSTVVARLG